MGFEVLSSGDAIKSMSLSMESIELREPDSV
jgi:hypothetical protein